VAITLRATLNSDGSDSSVGTQSRRGSGNTQERSRDPSITNLLPAHPFSPTAKLPPLANRPVKWRDALAYIPTQIAGCVLGAIAANGMFESPQ
jgi:hypothetical protein